MSTFMKNIAKLVSGSVIAQALGVLLIPIITRLYNPTDFGVFQLLVSISSIIGVISCFSYELAIILPIEDEDSANIVVICITGAIITSIITGFSLLYFGNYVEKLLNAPTISTYFILIPIFIFLYGLFLTMNYWLSRRIRFGVISLSRLSNMISSKTIQITSFFINGSPMGLFFGHICGFFIEDLIMIMAAKKDVVYINKISIENIIKSAIKYRRFPLYSSWSTLANTVSTQIPSFMLSIFYSTTVVGYYSLANMAINLPMAIVGSAVSQVFFQKANEEKNKIGNVKNIVSSVYTKLICFGIFPLMVLVIISKEIFIFSFGSEWSTAGVYVQILAPWIFLVFVSSPLSSLFNILEKQSIGLFFNLSILVSRICVLYIGGIYGGPLLALSLFSITGILFWGWMNIYLLKISKVNFKEILKPVFKYILISSFLSVSIITLKYIQCSTLLLLLTTGLTLLIYYTLVIFYENMMLRTKVLNLIVGLKNE